MKQSEEERHALTLSTTLSWLRGFAAARGAYNGQGEDMPPMYAIESALQYFQRRANGEYSPEEDGIKALANYAPGTVARKVAMEKAAGRFDYAENNARLDLKRDGRSDPARAAERSARSKRVWAKRRATAKKGKR